MAGSRTDGIGSGVAVTSNGVDSVPSAQSGLSSTAVNVSAACS